MWRLKIFFFFKWVFRNWGKILSKDIYVYFKIFKYFLNINFGYKLVGFSWEKFYKNLLFWLIVFFLFISDVFVEINY